MYNSTFGVVTSVSQLQKMTINTLLRWKRIRSRYRSGTKSIVSQNAIWCHTLEQGLGNLFTITDRMNCALSLTGRKNN